MSREELILSLGPQVNLIVNKMYRDFPTFFDRDDVVIEAWIGAIQAVDRFDSARNTKLKTLAEYNIRGRILDFYRRVDPVSRWTRKKIKAGEEEAPRIISLEEAEVLFQL